MSQPGAGVPGSYDRRVPTSPDTRSPSLRSPRVLWLVPLVVALIALSSCGGQAPTSAATSQGGQAIGSALERRGGPAAHLLAADKMPTAGAAWTGTDTLGEDLGILGPCHAASLVDIGALSTARRTWSAAGSVPRAVQQVAKFADSKSAWRAHQVLGAWRDGCDALVDGGVGPMRTVAVDTGVGQAYRVGQGDQATDLGIVRKGAYLSVVALVARSPQLPDDSSLAKADVKRIAATF